MLVEWYDPVGTLIVSRPQAAIPALGTPVPVQEPSGAVTRYRVALVEWPLVRPEHAYYGLTDAAEVVVRVYLVDAWEALP